MAKPIVLSKTTMCLIEDVRDRLAKMYSSEVHLEDCAISISRKASTFVVVSPGPSVGFEYKARYATLRGHFVIGNTTIAKLENIEQESHRVVAHYYVGEGRTGEQPKPHIQKRVAFVVDGKSLR